MGGKSCQRGNGLLGRQLCHGWGARAAVATRAAVAASEVIAPRAAVAIRAALTASEVMATGVTAVSWLGGRAAVAARAAKAPSEAMAIRAAMGARDAMAIRAVMAPMAPMVNRAVNSSHSCQWLPRMR
jgi:hypothetical protein